MKAAGREAEEEAKQNEGYIRSKRVNNSWWRHVMAVALCILVVQFFF